MSDRKSERGGKSEKERVMERGGKEAWPGQIRGCGTVVPLGLGTRERENEQRERAEVHKSCKSHFWTRPGRHSEGRSTPDLCWKWREEGVCACVCMKKGYID